MDYFLNRKQEIWLLIFLVAIFFISLSYSFYFQISPAVDAGAYDNIAWNIVLGNGYRETLDTTIQQDNSIIRIGPGYEIFLALIYYIFGHNYEAVWIIQALLSALSALLIFLITKEIFQTRWNYFIGLTAAVLIGFSPDLITMQGMLMTETLGIFLIILTSYLFCRYYNAAEKSPVLALWLGLAVGSAALVRTPAAFLFFPIAVYFLTAKNWKHLFLAGIAILALFLPWIARNYQIYGVFAPTNAAAGFNLLTGNHPGASGEQGDFSVLDRYPSGLNGVQVNKLATNDAIKFILSNPWEFLKLTIYRISIYFSFARPTGFWFHLSGWSKAVTLTSSAVYSVLLFILGFWGIWQIRNLEAKEKTLAKIFLAMLVMMPLAVVGIIIETRYRMLAYPFFAVFAGYGLSEFLAKRISWKPALYLALLLLTNAVFDILRNWERIIERIRDLSY
ncbi:MAG: glycosyltransferase family 39 protein [Candidatus Harrisonbacteria bacterium]|nr:glycosyltransferase family 39 protein [Candidatus Harrisonbacteria bacterium]